MTQLRQLIWATVACGGLIGNSSAVNADINPDAMPKLNMAVMSCRSAAGKDGYAADFYKSAYDQYRANLDEAIKIDPGVKSYDGNVHGKPMAHWRQVCEQELRKKFEVAGKKEEQRNQETKAYIAAHQQREAQKAKEAAAHVAQMRKLLKGDRLKVWNMHGDPSDYPGKKIEKAGYWVYQSSFSDGTECRREYWFSGNKIKRSKEKGLGCSH